MKRTAPSQSYSFSGCTAAAQEPAPSYPAMAPTDQYRFANPDDQVAFARTAAPPSISDHAKVLVLGKKGYQTAVEGDNGFVCFVERSWAAKGSAILGTKSSPIEREFRPDYMPQPATK